MTDKKLVRILVGDDEIEDYAQRYFSEFSGVEFDFVDNPEDLVEKANLEHYPIVVTDLTYISEEKGRRLAGFDVLEALRDYGAVKILWTGDSEDNRQKAQSLGATLVAKRDITSYLKSLLEKMNGVDD
ncbi:hypothetical protein ACFLZC_01490 [Patescibacteria group bacterium]